MLWLFSLFLKKNFCHFGFAEPRGELLKEDIVL